jgi:hypothetical protein
MAIKVVCRYVVKLNRTGTKSKVSKANNEWEFSGLLDPPQGGAKRVTKSSPEEGREFEGLLDPPC